MQQTTRMLRSLSSNEIDMTRCKHGKERSINIDSVTVIHVANTIAQGPMY